MLLENKCPFCRLKEDGSVLEMNVLKRVLGLLKRLNEPCIISALNGFNQGIDWDE